MHNQTDIERFFGANLGQFRCFIYLFIFLGGSIKKSLAVNLS